MTGVAVAVTAIVVGVPTLASADPVSDLLHNLGLGGNTPTTGSSGTGGGGTATPDAGSPPSYTPPLHGSNPHGQGTVGTVDLLPSNSNPLSGDPTQSGEEIVAGDSRGEQNGSSYHGTVTLLSALGITVPGLLQVQSNPGETKEGPLDPIQKGILDNICTATSNAICLTVLQMHSQTGSNSSNNQFEAAGVHLGGPGGINASAAGSQGNISDDGTCQNAHGDSHVANANVGALTVGAVNGSSDSQACNNGTQSVNQSSSVVNLNGTGLAIPVAGCDNGTPNSNLVIPLILSAVCNADNQNSGVASSPYGVREGLTAFLVNLPGVGSLVKATTAGPESHAVAPASNTTPPTTPSGGGGTKGAGGKGGNNGGNGGGGNGGGSGNGPAAGTPGTGNGQLAFTGADLLALAMVGGALILGGLALTATAGRRHRRTI